MLAQEDFLHTDGKAIVNERGEKVQLRGTNLGGWLMREGWLDGSGACRKPVEVQTRTVKGSAVTLKLKGGQKWNRVHLNQAAFGRYSVKVSGDGLFYKELHSGNFSEDYTPKWEDGKAPEYMMGGNIYNQGAYYHNGTLYFNQDKLSYIRIETEQVLDASRLEVTNYADVDDYTARAVLVDRFGSLEAERLLGVYQNAFITERDLDDVAALGLNFVRLPIYWQELMNFDGTFKANAWENTDWIVAECKKRDIYVMLDFHGSPGGHTMGSITCGQEGSNELWKNKKYQEMDIAAIAAMCDRYKDEPAVAMIDLLNEPVAHIVIPVKIDKDNPLHMKFAGITRNIVIKMYKQLYDAARSVDARHILVLQPFVDYEMLGDPKAHGWENVAYQYHSYGMGFRDRDKVERSMRFYLDAHEKYANKYNIPILAGEFCFWEFLDVWEEWLKGLNRLELPWCSWSYKIIDTVRRDNWSVRYAFKGDLVDFYRDSAEEIERKWKEFSSDNYEVNEDLARLLSKYATE